MKKTIGIMMTFVLVFCLTAGLMGVEKKPGVPGITPDLKLAKIEVTYPTAGLVFTKGLPMPQPIGWNATNIPIGKMLKIVLKATSAGNGGIFPVAANLAPSAGAQGVSYTIPANMGYDGPQFKIIISTMDDKTIGESGLFSIENPRPLPAIMISEPTPATVWVRGGSGLIKWTAIAGVGNVRIYLKATSAGAGGIFEVTPSIASTAGSISYNISANMGYSGKQFVIYIDSLDGKNKAASGIFTIN